MLLCDRIWVIFKVVFCVILKLFVSKKRKYMKVNNKFFYVEEFIRIMNYFE